jgi:hypothetical protein
LALKKALEPHCLLLIALFLPVMGMAQKRDSVMYGVASYYHSKFNGRRTSNGEIFRNDSLTAAHKYLPFGTRVRVTNLNNDSSVIVRINDRLPQSSTRSIDLSQAAARKLDMMKAGIVKARIEIIPPGVTRVSPIIAGYLLERNGTKIDEDVIRKLKSGTWDLCAITDTLNGVLTDYVRPDILLRLDYSDTTYRIKQFGNIGSAKWSILDSMIILHEQVENIEGYNLEPKVDFKGPFLIYKINEDTLRLGKPLTSNGTWHRTYCFTRDRTKEKQIVREKTVRQQNDSIYSRDPKGITKEQSRIGGCNVEKIVIKKDDKVDVYIKKTWDWGGVFYFRNDVSITEEQYEKETGTQ